MERLQKVMAESGIGSRRYCEEIIREGLVKVNGEVIKKLPVLVDPQQDRIIVEGRRLRFERKVYFLLNKPKKVVCTNSDPQGRTRAIDLLKGVKERIYPVGRLDADSKGLVIMTNDGELANQLTHPKYGVAKTYIAEVAGSVSGAEIERLQKGMYLAKGKASMGKVKILRRGPKQSLLEVTLREGRKRQIKVMLGRLGHTVKQLTRVQIGKLTLKGLGVGKYRILTTAEVKSLQRLSKPVDSQKKRTKKK
ncbi:MAG: rRNA pseudouridine synthase [Planctomycetes bacterium]|nr:rRNA pseudouridine synthase [Planctomycetota bacterium]